MTPAQIDVLRRLIAADRRFHSAKAAGKFVSENERGLEIGLFNGVDPRTAASLVDAGLAESTTLPGLRHAYLFLGNVNPYDEFDEGTLF